MAVKLSAKQKAFVHHYIKTLNATQAAIAAGYSERSARQYGSENLAKPYIKEIIEKKIREQLTNVDELTLQFVNEVKRLSFYNIKNILDENGEPKNLLEVDDETASAIEEFTNVHTVGENTETYTKKVKMVSKTQALNILGKYLNILDNSNQNQVKPETEKEKMTREQRQNRILELSKKLGKNEIK